MCMRAQETEAMSLFAAPFPSMLQVSVYRQGRLDGALNNYLLVSLD